MSLVPNSTQIPHIIIRGWMPMLSDVELRVLLVVADQTLGWIEDVETGRRKEKDWISHTQLCKKTGRSDRGITTAVKTLIGEHKLIQAYDEAGNLLDTSIKRQKLGNKIFYRLSLHQPPATLFDTPSTSAKFAGVGKKASKTVEPPQNLRPQNLRTTKETPLTKEIHASEKSDAEISRKKDHMVFVDFWYEMVKKTRQIKPVITSVDGQNLKRVLTAGVPESLLEQIALFFLADYSFKKFSPMIQTLCSSGVLNGLLNLTKNDSEFHRKLNQYVTTYMRSSIGEWQRNERNTLLSDIVPPTPEVKTYGLLEFQAGVQQLAAKFAAPKRYE